MIFALGIPGCKPDSRVGSGRGLRLFGPSGPFTLIPRNSAGQLTVDVGTYWLLCILWIDAKMTS